MVSLAAVEQYTVMAYRVFALFVIYWRTMWSIVKSQSTLILSSRKFTWSLTTFYSISLVSLVIHRDVRPWAWLISLGKSMAYNSPGRPSGNLIWWKSFELVLDAWFCDCDGSNSWVDDIKLGIYFSSIFTVPVVDERMQYGPSFRESNLEYKSGTSWFASVRGSGGQAK